LNDEGIIIGSARTARNMKIFEPHAGVGILGVFDDVKGCAELRQKRSLLDPFREGPWPAGIWARAASSILIMPRTLAAAGIVDESVASSAERAWQLPQKRLDLAPIANAVSVG
jgi:hypothetical protein